MALSFPVSPSLNQTYTVGSKTWIWNGYAWDLQATGFSVAPGQASIGVYLDTFTMDGTANTCTLPIIPSSANNIIVNVNGVEQLKSAYTLNSNVITLSETPINGTIIDVRTFRTDTDVANSASSYANSAFSKANTASGTATASFIQANTAFNAANTKTSLGKSIAMTIVFGG